MKYSFELKPYPWKEYVDANTPKPGGIKGMHFIEFGFVNVNEIHEREKIKDNYGRLGDNITADDLKPIIGVYMNGEYDFAAYEPPVLTPEGKLVAGEHRLIGKKKTKLKVDVSKEKKYGGEWLFVAICSFDDLEALRDYSFKENNEKKTSVKRYSSLKSSETNIVKYLETLEPKYRTKSAVLAKLKATSWEGCEIDGEYKNYTNAKKKEFAEDCLKSIGIEVESKKRYDRDDVISEFVDEKYTKITPIDDPNTYIGNFKSPTSVTGYEPNFIRATESLIPLIIKGEDVNIIAYIDAPRNKVAADKLRKKIADTYYKNIIESAYGIVSCDMNISAKELKKKAKGKLGKVTFYFCAVFKDDPLFTVIEATK